MPRLYQDLEFIATPATGRPLLRLCALVDPERDDAVVIALARLDRPLEWHRLFLDAGAAFWETWPDDQIEDELADDDLRVVELLAAHLPRTIVRARAYEAAPGRAARIALTLAEGPEVELRCEGDEVDAPTRVVIRERPPSAHQS